MEQTGKIIIDQVSKKFSTKSGEMVALQETSLTIKEGEFVTILGPSGCGKSTLLRIIAGLEQPSSGRILMKDKVLTEPGTDRGMVFQAYTLFPWLTVQDNIAFGLQLKGISKKEQQEITQHYLHLIGLEGFENHYPIQLSGGMKQRVAIARALANDPKVLLMDEPFGALDAQTREQMQELLLKVWEEAKKTIVFITHDVEEAIFLGDTVYVMTARPGKIKAKIDITLPRPRNFHNKNSAKFMNLKAQLFDLIREESLKVSI